MLSSRFALASYCLLALASLSFARFARRLRTCSLVFACEPLASLRALARLPSLRELASFGSRLLAWQISIGTSNAAADHGTGDTRSALVGCDDGCTVASASLHWERLASVTYRKALHSTRSEPKPKPGSVFRSREVASVPNRNHVRQCGRGAP